MYLKGNIIENIYKLAKTDAYIEIWQTYSHNSHLNVKNILIPDDSYWDSTSIIDEPFFVLHFKNMLVHSDKYSLKIARIENLPDYQIKSWKVFGSMDNNTWILIDEKIDNNELKSTQMIDFSMKESVFSWYKFSFQRTTFNSKTVYLNRVEIHGKTFPNYQITRKENLPNIFLSHLSCYLFHIK